MTIETQFNYGDVIWYVDKNTLAATSNTVQIISVTVNNTGTAITYTVNTNVIVPAANAFVSQAALAASYEPA